METTSNEVLKQESVGYFKSAINLQQGTLTLTPQGLSLTAHKTTVGGGLLGMLLKKYVEKEYTVFNLAYNDIGGINQDKRGFMEVIDDKNATHRISVKNYQEWNDAIKQRMK